MKEAYAAWTRIYQLYLTKITEKPTQLYTDIQMLEQFFESHLDEISTIKVIKGL